MPLICILLYQSRMAFTRAKHPVLVPSLLRCYCPQLVFPLLLNTKVGSVTVQRFPLFIAIIIFLPIKQSTAALLPDPVSGIKRSRRHAPPSIFLPLSDFGTALNPAPPSGCGPSHSHPNRVKMDRVPHRRGS